jgi:hypothetical protein
VADDDVYTACQENCIYGRLVGHLYIVREDKVDNCIYVKFKGKDFTILVLYILMIYS